MPPNCSWFPIPLTLLRRPGLGVFEEDERALFVGRHDGGVFVAVDGLGEHLGADARIVVDFVGGPRHLAVVAFKLEPIEYRRRMRLCVAVGAVGVIALAGDDVLEAVAVNVHEVDGVHLGDLHALRVFGFVVADDDVLLEAAVFLLLEPGQAVAVGFDAGDNVGPAIAVDVIGEHLRAAAAEVGGVKRPLRVAAQVGGLLVPAVMNHEIVFPVPIYVAEAHAVGESLIVFFGADGVEGPRLSRVGVIGLRVTEPPGGHADQHRLAIAEQVAERGGFIVGDIENFMANPVPVGGFLAARVFVPTGVFAGESDDQDVVPFVVLEAAGEGEEVVRILSIWIEFGLGLHVLMAFLEIRPFVPVRPGDHVGLAVVIKVAEGGAFAEEFVGERDLFPLDFGAGFGAWGGWRGGRFGGGKGRAQQQRGHGSQNCFGVHGNRVYAIEGSVKQNPFT